MENDRINVLKLHFMAIYQFTMRNEQPFIDPSWFQPSLIVRALTSICLPGKYRKNWGVDLEEMVLIIYKTHFLQVESATPGHHTCAKSEKWVSCLPILKHDITFSYNINFYISDFPKMFQKTIHATWAISEKIL